jgi:hypothetical protein
MADRFFVKVFARDPEHQHRLFDYGLDLFAAGEDERGHPTIDGLVTLDTVARLVEDGYQVLVAETDSPPEKLPTVGFDAWLKDSLADLDDRTRQGG